MKQISDGIELRFSEQREGNADQNTSLGPLDIALDSIPCRILIPEHMFFYSLHLAHLEGAV